MIELKQIASSDTDARYTLALGDGTHVGGISVYGIDSDRLSFSFGIALARNMRGKGYAALALRELFALYRAQGFTRCVSRVFEDNAASIRLHERVGFVQDGRSTREGRNVIHFSFDLTSEAPI